MTQGIFAAPHQVMLAAGVAPPANTPPVKVEEAYPATEAKKSQR